MKRIVRWGLFLVAALILLGLGALLWIDSLTKAAVERGGTHALGVETRLEDASIGLFSGEFGLSGLAVANPPGFAQPSFFALRSAHLSLPLGQLLESRVTIPALELEGITLDLERNAQGTNFGQILDHLARFETEGSEPDGEPSQGGGKVFHVQRLALRDIRATVQLLPAGGALTKLDVTVPEIVVEDLASDLTVPQLCAAVVKVVLRAALEAGQGTIPQELLQDLRGRVAGLETMAHERLSGELDALEEQLGEHAKKLGPEAEQALKKASDELGGKLDGLFKKKD